MDWFSGSKPKPPAGTDVETARRNAASAESLARGGLPLDALDRLQEQAKRQGTPQHCFSSDLSVNEFYLVRQAGVEPLGQVLGSTIYRVGTEWREPIQQAGGTTYELSITTAGFAEARLLALGRLRQEAALLGASYVIGVRLIRREYDWGAGTLEFAAIGTAVRDCTERAPKEPVLSNLSGQEFWSLRAAGFRPVGFVAGNCALYHLPSAQLEQQFLFFRNLELTEYTTALYQARSQAMERMESEARSLSASGYGSLGIVGVTVEMDGEELGKSKKSAVYAEGGGMVFHFTALGTAVFGLSTGVPKPQVQLPVF